MFALLLCIVAACASARHLSASSSSVQGRRAHMEDEIFVSQLCHFSAVFDGHGGSKVSAYLRSNFFSRFLQELPVSDDKVQWSTSMIKQALRSALKKCDEDIGLLKNWQHQGSTAVVVFVRCDGDERSSNGDDEGEDKGGDAGVVDTGSVICMNVGDSRAVLARSGRAVDLSDDHKPDRDDERERIVKLGGTVKWHGLIKNRKPLAGSGCYRVNGNLALSRAVGDWHERPFVAPTPEFTTTSLTPQDDFICVASDGLWDVFSSQELVSFVLACRKALLGVKRGDEEDDLLQQVDRREVSQAVASFHRRNNKSIEMHLREELFRRGVAGLVVDAAGRRGSSDNISVVIIWLK